MLASGFTNEDLVDMLGKDRADSLKEGDLVAFTSVLYNADAQQVNVSCCPALATPYLVL